MVKKILVLARKTIKLIILLGISILLIICAVALFFKPIYGVTLNGEQIGYSKDKSKLQAKINKYMESGDGQSNVAFVQMEAMPEYKMCLLKRNIVTNDDEIFETVKKQGITYYNYYAISIGEEIKAYVSDFASAEEIVNQLKEKESTNADEIVITEMYETNLEEFSDVETVVADLYVKKVELPKVAKNSGKVNTSAVVTEGTPQAKEAVLDYEVEQVSENGQQALVHIWLHTGRHHQIRVQFAHAGYPLVGDTKYGKTDQNSRYCPVALCSCRIGFVHPVTKKKMEFVIEPKGKAFSRVAKHTKNV